MWERSKPWKREEIGLREEMEGRERNSENVCVIGFSGIYVPDLAAGVIQCAHVKVCNPVT